MPIVCWSYEHKKQIEQTAREIDVKGIMPEPILATEVRKKVIGNRRGLIVDDLDILLRRILDDNVYYATMEDCNCMYLKWWEEWYIVKENDETLKVIGKRYMLWNIQRQVYALKLKGRTVTEEWLIDILDSLEKMQ